MELFSTEFLHSQIFWTAVAFAVLLGIISRFVVPAVNAVLDARAAAIKADLDSAAKHRVEAEKTLADYSAQLAQARKEAAEVVSRARAEAEAMSAQRLKEVEAEIARKGEAARHAIEAAKAEAMRGLHAEVANLALNVAETLLAEKVDAKQATKLTDAALKRGLN
jgi:F-type H+-transporting ATPase subunit b